MKFFLFHRFVAIHFSIVLMLGAISTLGQDDIDYPELPDAGQVMDEALAADDTQAEGENSAEEDADAALESESDFQLEDEEAQPKPLLAKINGVAFKILFFDISHGLIKIPAVRKDGSPILSEHGLQGTRVVELPFLVMVLLFGAIFFTLWYRWINIRGFRHAIDVIAGKFDKADDPGEVSHFRALTSALSATVGLGNIAGVAVAIQMGGPGAVFWMLLAAVFGMSAKFSSCVLSQMYRQVNADGSISGGPMYYLDLGLKDMGLGFLGKVLGIMFALMVMGGAIGGGNMFQANQTAEAFSATFGLENSLVIGIVMAVLVGAVVLGGIKRIGLATSRIVPVMCGLYVVTSLFIILSNFTKIPECLALIFKMAFTGNAFFGGMAGVLVMGIKRAAFSNEAGLGSAAIAHAAAKTDEPVREGIVAMMGPFIDTIIVCLMTALVVIITGTWNDPSIPQSAGVSLTTAAFGSALP